MEKYQKGEKVGEGTYATVFQAREKSSNQEVAIKKIKIMEKKEGVHFSAVREIKFLRELSHPNVVQILDVFVHKENIHLVLEYLETDLDKIIKDKEIVLSAPHIKSWMFMALSGVDFCHKNWCLHRDLKPDNLLIGSNGILKLADFGLAKFYGDEKPDLSPQVVTRWYRAPELLMGSRNYGGEIDIWAVGCIFAELWLRIPYIQGNTDIEQLKEIFKALGTPSESDWPGVTSLPDYLDFEKFQKTPFSVNFRAVSADALDLLDKMLTLNPPQRLTAEGCLRHEYFKNLPRPTNPAKLPKPILDRESKKRQDQNGREGEFKKQKQLNFENPKSIN